MPKSIVTLGTFDGVHRGHQALLRKVLTRAKATKTRSVVISFGMPPRHAGETLSQPVLLTTLHEKLGILKRLGIDRVQVLVFNKRTASTSPDDFFNQTVVTKNKAAEMVVGPRVAFGRRRAGRLPLLKQLGKANNVAIHVVPSIQVHGETLSSRRIRALLRKGHVEKAHAYLGYPYSISGRVIHGDHRGRQLGFPTANIHLDGGKIVPPGVFWVKVFRSGVLPLDAKTLAQGYDAVCNVGYRPTFTPESKTLHCEVFILESPRQARWRLYGKELRVVFMQRLRGEMRFSSPAQLQRQIARDVTDAKDAARLYKNPYFSI